MNVTKIKIKKDRVAIDYNKIVIVDDHESINKYSIVSPEHPTIPFKTAFQKMDFFLIEMCELCGKLDEIPIMCEDVNITGLSFKYDDEDLSGAVITGTKALAYSNSPLVLNSPHKSVNFGGEWNKMIHLTGPCINALQSVIEQAKKYVSGERLQIEMDLKEPEFGMNAEGPIRAEVGDTTPKQEKPQTEEELRLPDFEDDGINTTKDARDDSEDIDIPSVPE